MFNDIPLNLKPQADEWETSLSPWSVRRTGARKPVPAPSKPQLRHSWSLGSPWRRGRSEQQCLPEGPCAQPALALLIHSVFVKQTFNFTGICQMTPAPTRQLPEHCRYLFYVLTLTRPKLAAAACGRTCRLQLDSRNKKRNETQTDTRCPDCDGKDAQQASVDC